MNLPDIFLEPWPWYFSGSLLGILVALMLWLGSSFGVSGNLDSICGIFGADRFTDYFKFDVKDRLPSLIFVAGSVCGGFLAANYLTLEGYSVDTAASTVEALSELGISNFEGLQPSELFSLSFLGTPQGLILLVGGGFLIGFGSRWAGGCTSGHSISGMSSMQLPSLVATIGFFIGGLIATHLLMPLIFGL
ncbi:MAG: YeeE/YedE family protein [Flavobacteriales bacterium]|nr:YeeE/YedE family protein [Flavobacteriales bacterium]